MITAFVDTPLFVMHSYICTMYLYNVQKYMLAGQLSSLDWNVICLACPTSRMYGLCQSMKEVKWQWQKNDPALEITSIDFQWYYPLLVYYVYTLVIGILIKQPFCQLSYNRKSSRKEKVNLRFNSSSIWPNTAYRVFTNGLCNPPYTWRMSGIYSTLYESLYSQLQD